MRFYKAVEPAELCFLSEAVELVAFGRIPEAWWADFPEVDSSGNLSGIDLRFHWKEMPDNFEPNSIGFEFFEAEEFEAGGVEMHPDYHAAAASVLFGEIADAKGTVELFSEQIDIGRVEDPEVKAEFTKKREDAERILIEGQEIEALFRQENEKMELQIEKSWAKIFAQIHSGNLSVQGVNYNRWESLVDEKEDYCAAGEFVEVPSDAFRLGHDYTQNSVFYDGIKYVATRVASSDLLARVALEANNFQASDAKRFGQTLIVASDTGKPRSGRPKRGAPYAIDWRPVRDYLNALAANGDLPSKKDACIQELIEFALRRFGRRVGRTTVQTRLRADLDRAYAQKPD